MGAVHLVLDVLAQQRRVGRHGLEGVDQHRQGLVLHLDQLDRIGGRIAVLGDDEGDLLVLEQHLLLGQHRLHVARKRRHVVQAQRLQLGGGQHGDDAGKGRRLGDVDLLDPRMAIGRAHEIAIERARQLQIVDVIALALDEADVLDALALATHALQALDAFLAGGRCDLVHSAASCSGRPESLAAAN